MKFKTLLRHNKEGIKNLARNGWMTFASVSAVTVTLLLVGVFLLLLLNINAIATQLEDDVEIRVYLDITADEKQQDELKKRIDKISNVKSIKFVSKEEGLAEFIESLGEQGEVFKFLEDENPLPDAYVVKTTDPQDTAKVAEQIQHYEHVSSINYGKGTVEKLFKVTETARNIGIILILGLLFTAMFLIANTIKLTIVSRGREIEIMKLVGATNSFIRWPFFVEGLLLGIIGALIPIVLLYFGYQLLYEAFSVNLATLFVQLLPVNTLMLKLSGLLISLGALIGVWGSLTSVRKFLRV
jgi:cell division transport system permease protein